MDRREDSRALGAHRRKVWSMKRWAFFGATLIAAVALAGAQHQRSTHRRRHSFLLAFGFMVATLPLLSQAPRDQEHVGQYSETEILRGSQIYTNTCAVCHGLTGNALVAVDLARNRFRNAVTDEDLGRVVRSGIPGLGMPSFSLADADLSAVIVFIRSGLGTSSPVPTARIGDAARGRMVFEGKGGCL